MEIGEGRLDHMFKPPISRLEKTEVMIDQSCIILFHSNRCVVECCQSVGFDVSDNVAGIAEAVVDVLDMTPLQLQKAAADRHGWNLLSANPDRFLCGAGGFRHQFHIAINGALITGMV